MTREEQRRIEYLESLINSISDDKLPLLCGCFFKALYDGYGWSLESIAEMFGLTKHNIMECSVTANELKELWEKVNEKCRY